MHTADVVVIGGGIIGTSIAYRLAQQGRKTILVERGTLGAATSGSCDKAVFLQSKKPGIHLELADASRTIYEHLEEELGIPFEFNACGGMIVIETEEQNAAMQPFVEQQRGAGIPIQLLDRKEAMSIQPELATHIVGATWCDRDAEVNPLLLTYAFAQAATTLGAKILAHTTVTGIGCNNGRVSEVYTTEGKIVTEIVINAAGPFAPAIGDMLGLSIPIRPRRGAILITEKVPALITGNLLCAQYITAKHQGGREVNGSLINPYGVGLSLGQTEAGNLLIGGSREFVGFDRQLPAEVLSSIADHAGRIVPKLRDIRIIRSMVGFRPSTGDGLPIISDVPEIMGLYIAAGHEGDGIALSPISGVLMADLLEGGKRFEKFLSYLSLQRFRTTEMSS